MEYCDILRFVELVADAIEEIVAALCQISHKRSTRHPKRIDKYQGISANFPRNYLIRQMYLARSDC